MTGQFLAFLVFSFNFIAKVVPRIDQKAPETPFGRYAIFRFFLSIAIGISLPFFTIYLLRDLNLSYIWYIAITVSSTFFQLIFMPLMGKVSDKNGNIKLTKISAGLLFLIPLLWYFSSFINNPLTQKIYLLLVPNILAGFAWSGYNLATSNYVYDSVKQQKLSLGASYMNFLVGLSMFLGSAIGALIAWKGVLFMNTTLFIFLLSAGARLAVFIIGFKSLKEVRPVQKFSSRYLIKEFKPFHELAKDISYIEHFAHKDKI